HPVVVFVGQAGPSHAQILVVGVRRTKGARRVRRNATRSEFTRSDPAVTLFLKRVPFFLRAAARRPRLGPRRDGADPWLQRARSRFRWAVRRVVCIGPPTTRRGPPTRSATAR